MISNVIVFLFILNLYSSFILGFTGIGIFDDISGILLVFFQAFLIISIPKKNLFVSKLAKKIIIVYIMIFTLNFISSFIFNASLFNLNAFIYEIYKLSTYLILVPIVFLNSKILLNVINKFIGVIFFFLILNLFVTLLQFTLGANIITLFGLKDPSFTDFTEQGLITGITPGKNINGLINFYMLVFCLILEKFTSITTKYNVNISSKKIKYLKYLCIIGIIFSSTKIVIFNFLLLLLIFSKIKARYKYTIVLSSIILVVFGMYNLNIYQLKEKVGGYRVLISKFDYVTRKYSRALNKVEARGIDIVRCYVLTRRNFPKGTGLGTWGDTSSSFNPKAKYTDQYSKSSDSHFTHMLVEQGILIFLYFYLFYLFTKNNGKLGMIVFITFIPIEISMMGPSSGIYPLIIAFDFSLLLLMQKERALNSINLIKEVP